jgi:small-conductance mechanosensitive channel
VFSLVAVVGWVSYFVFEHYFSAWAKKTQTTLDDDILANVKSIAVLLVILVGTYYALTNLAFTEAYKVQLYDAFTIADILLIAFAATRVTNVLADWYGEKKRKQNIASFNHMIFILKKLMQLIIVIVAFLVILYALNVNFTNIVVGLGVGGIAIAFALQSTLSDIFSAFSLYFDRPFEIGDFVVVGEHSGTVTNIGMRSTRLKLLQGEELVISNKELTNGRVRNFRKLEKRRVAFTIGVTYDTPSEKLRKVPDIIKNIVSKSEFAELDRVNFTEFGDFSLKFLVIYYIKVADYGKYMDTQQEINYAIKEAFEQEGIEIAYPTQTITIKNKT